MYKPINDIPSEFRVFQEQIQIASVVVTKAAGI